MTSLEDAARAALQVMLGAADSSFSPLFLFPELPLRPLFCPLRQRAEQRGALRLSRGDRDDSQKVLEGGEEEEKGEELSLASLGKSLHLLARA